MPVVFPQARIEFEAEPVCAIVPDQSALLFLADTDTLEFAAEAVVAFDFAPFNVEIVPIDGASLYNEDSGVYLFNEDTGISLFAEEAT